jgi:hypothetical protein
MAAKYCFTPHNAYILLGAFNFITIYVLLFFRKDINIHMLLFILAFPLTIELNDFCLQDLRFTGCEFIICQLLNV